MDNEKGRNRTGMRDIEEADFPDMIEGDRSYI
jgi:hypothetical protein